jgi:hypothetical protein
VFQPGAIGTTVNAIHILGNGDSLAVIVSHHELLNIGWPGREPLRTEHFAWIVSRREPGHSQPAKFVPRSARDTFRLPHAHGIAISADGRWLHSAGRLCDLNTGERRGHLMGWDMLSAFRADGEEIAFSYAGHGTVLFFPRSQWRNVKVETD